MNVAALAILGPHVSTMISRVRALDPISIPLLTNMINGRSSSFRVGFSSVKMDLKNP